MTSVFDPKHKHYAVHKAYVEGCFANPNDPPIVEIGWFERSTPWLSIPDPEWKEHCEYRIRPRTVTRTITYPKPITTIPVKGTIVWMVASNRSIPVGLPWDSMFSSDVATFKNGMCFATEADALACHEALFGK